jgi:predicted nucleotidyltransferase
MIVPAEKLKKMAEYALRTDRVRQEAISTRVIEAFAEVERLVGEFRALDPSIEKIVLFGSLARKDITSPDFDIDLAVACSKERYLAIVALALDSPFQVDVVDLAVADDRIKASIARDGVVLYEK